jgi:hypothetical protein
MRPAGSAYAVADLRLTVGLIVALLLLVGCSATGDFGRPRYFSPLYAEPAASDPVYTGSIAASAFALTDEERQLRALGKNLLVGPEGPKKFARAHLVQGPEPELLAGIPPEKYIRYVVHGPFRSATARYGKLIDDTRNDIVRLDPFFLIARRVADLDRKRERGLAYVSGLSAEELIDARRRIRENMMLMVEVHRVLLDRVAMYRLTLERLVIALPSPMAVEAERIRSDLEQRLAAIQVVGEAPAAQAK